MCSRYPFQRRGRPCAWQTVHPSTGACKKCVLCGRTAWQQRFTHPATWNEALKAEARRLGLELSACICRLCHNSTFKSGKSSRLGSASEGLQVSDAEAEGADSSGEASVSYEVTSDGEPDHCSTGESQDLDVVSSPVQTQTNPVQIVTVPSNPACLPPLSSEPIGLSTRPSSNSIMRAATPPVQIQHASTPPLPATPPPLIRTSPMVSLTPIKREVFKCAIPKCDASMYAHLGHASSATVAAILHIDVADLSCVSNDRVPLCTAHYRSIWRVLRIMPCLVCNARGQPEMQREFRHNAEQLAISLNQAGVKHNITAAMACCTPCFHQRMNKFCKSPGEVMS